MADHNTLVCDNGSFSLKAGFSGDDAPRTVMPTVIGTPRDEVEIGIPEYEKKHVYSGRFVEENQHLLNTTRPIVDGKIVDWDAMEEVWTHMYYEDLLVPPEKCNILHTESIDNPMSSREKLTEIMFELFNVPSSALLPKSTLALFGNGKTTGLVVDSGYENTRVVPIHEGFPLTYYSRNMPVGGRHITNYFLSLLNHRGYGFTNSINFVNLRYMKELCCYFSLDFEKDLFVSYGRDKEQRYKMPDGTVIELGNESFRAPEIMFDPILANIECEVGGLHHMIHKSIGACSTIIQDIMYNNIILAGGNTLFPFFSDRLNAELVTLASPTTKIEISGPPESEYSTWIGGSILASSSNGRQSFVTKSEYEEQGPRVVHNMCFF